MKPRRVPKADAYNSPQIKSACAGGVGLDPFSIRAARRKFKAVCETAGNASGTIICAEAIQLYRRATA